MQAAFRGFQVRRQYRKILWSVGVLEKAILRWRFKRRGFRGLQVDPPIEDIADQSQGSDTEEDFFKTSRKQAEERVEKAVVRVQSMFRSKKAQEDYRKMKLAHHQAMVGFVCFFLYIVSITDFMLISNSFSVCFLQLEREVFLDSDIDLVD